MENEQEHTTMAPSIWVDNDKKVLYYPPKGKKTVGAYIAEWASPKGDWLSFQIVDTTLQAGPRDIAQQLFEYSSTEEKSPVKQSSPTESQLVEDVQTPDISVMKKKAAIQQARGSPRTAVKNLNQESFLRRSPRLNKPSLSATSTSPVFSKNSTSKKGMLEIFSQQELLSPIPLRPDNSNIDEDESNRSSNSKNAAHVSVIHASMYGDGGSKFKEMSTKKFQYAVLMELAEVKERLTDCLVEVERLKKERIDFCSEDEDLNQEVREVSETIEQFEEEELKLKSKQYFKRKQNVVRAFGGKKPREVVRNALDGLISLEVQSLFSRDGQKGKKALKNTNHYKLITATLVNPDKGLDKATMSELVMDLLKRAPSRRKETN